MEGTDEQHGFGTKNPSVALSNAMRNATVSVSRDGAVSGSGSWGRSYSTTVDTIVARDGLTGTRSMEETVSASVSFEGRIGEDGTGQVRITGTVTVSGSLTDDAERHATDGWWPKMHPDGGEYDYWQGYDYYNCVRAESQTWSYSFSLYDEDWCELTSTRNENGDYVDALRINVNGDARASGGATYRMDLTFPGMDWDETHIDTTNPIPNSAGVSALCIYFRS